MSTGLSIHGVENVFSDLHENTTSLKIKIIHEVHGFDVEGEYKSLSDETDITLFFDDAATARVFNEAINKAAGKP